MSALSKRSALLAAIILLTWVGTADAQWRRGAVVIRPGFVHTPFFYDPFWAPSLSVLRALSVRPGGNRHPCGGQAEAGPGVR